MPWEGRKEPIPFRWDNGDVVKPQPNEWLVTLDLKARARGGGWKSPCVRHPPPPPLAARPPPRANSRPRFAATHLLPPQKYGVAALVDEEAAADPLALQQELEATRAVLLHLGGQAQGVFTWMATSEGSSVEDFMRLRLSTFHRLIMDTRLSQGHFREENVQACLRAFTLAAKGEAVDVGRGEDTYLDFKASIFSAIFPRRDAMRCTVAA